MCPLGLELGGVLRMRLLLALRDVGESASANMKSSSLLPVTSPRRPTSHQAVESSPEGDEEEEQLTSSSPSHLWSSSSRCLPQKWPSQKAQSPAIRWAASLHSLNEHLIFLGILAVVVE